MSKFTYKKENLVIQILNNSWVTLACDLSVFCMLWFTVIFNMYFIELLVVPNLSTKGIYPLFYAIFFNFIALFSMVAIFKWCFLPKQGDSEWS